MIKKLLPLLFLLTTSLFFIAQYSFAELGTGCNGCGGAEQGVACGLSGTNTQKVTQTN
jgi:hypothetical protein